MDHVWGGYPCVSNYHNFPALSPPLIGKWIIPRMRTCLYLHNRYAHVYIYIPRMCIYLNYLYLLSRMRTCLYYRIFTAKHAPCLYLHSTHYAYISISTYLLSRSAHVYIYNQACAMSKYTLIYAHMSTFEFHACADVYIYILHMRTCSYLYTVYLYFTKRTCL
jgi:hypothetical protein